MRRRRAQAKKRSQKSRPTTKANPGPGRPTTAEAFTDAILAAKIRQVHDDLGGRVSAVEVYEKCLDLHLFSQAQLDRWARRAAVEYVRGTLGDNDPATGFPYKYPVLLGSTQLWISEAFLTDSEAAETVRAREKQLHADYGEYRRIWDRFALRFGADKMPPLVQITLDATA